MAWVLLVVAGLLEVGWSIGMKFTDGFTRLWPSVFTGRGDRRQHAAALARRQDPADRHGVRRVGRHRCGRCGRASACWCCGEPVTAARIFFVCLLLVAVVGLKATSGH